MLHLLKSFVEVADSESYTRAAESLYLGQPTVYHHVRQLERTLGTRLIAQNGKRALLTDHGRAARAYATQILALWDELCEVAADDATLTGGSLILCTGPTVGEFLLPEICVAFQVRFPGVKLAIRYEAFAAGIDSAVLERNADIGFHSSPVTTPGLISEPFAEDELVAIVPSGHRLAGRTEILPGDLASERFIQVDGAGRTRLRAIIDDWFASGGVKVTSILETRHLQAIKVAVRAGGGVSIVARHAVRPDDDSLVTIALAHAPRRPYFVITREEGWQSNLLRVFREFVLATEWIHLPDRSGLSNHSPAS